MTGALQPPGPSGAGSLSRRSVRRLFHNPTSPFMSLRVQSAPRSPTLSPDVPLRFAPPEPPSGGSESGRSHCASSDAPGPDGPAGPDAPDAAGGAGTPSEITPEEWDELRAPFAAWAYRRDFHVRAHHGTKAVIRLPLRRNALVDRLERVLGPGRYSFTFRMVSGTDWPTVRCHLYLGDAVRSGFGEDPRVRYAADDALVDAARAFGIGQAGDRAGRRVVDLDFHVHLPDEIKEELEAPYEPGSWAPSDT